MRADFICRTCGDRVSEQYYGGTCLVCDDILCEQCVRLCPHCQGRLCSKCFPKGTPSGESQGCAHRSSRAAVLPTDSWRGPPAWVPPVPPTSSQRKLGGSRVGVGGSGAGGGTVSVWKPGNRLRAVVWSVWAWPLLAGFILLALALFEVSVWVLFRSFRTPVIVLAEGVGQGNLLRLLLPVAYAGIGFAIGGRSPRFLPAWAYVVAGVAVAAVLEGGFGFYGALLDLNAAHLWVFCAAALAGALPLLGAREWSWRGAGMGMFVALLGWVVCGLHPVTNLHEAGVVLYHVWLPFVAPFAFRENLDGPSGGVGLREGSVRPGGRWDAGRSA